jgi:hypothetical protein
MTVRNDNDIKEIAKQLENYIRLHSKKWWYLRIFSFKLNILLI